MTLKLGNWGYNPTHSFQRYPVVSKEFHKARAGEIRVFRQNIEFTPVSDNENLWR